LRTNEPRLGIDHNFQNIWTVDEVFIFRTTAIILMCTLASACPIDTRSLRGATG
jgi:hypothetical protein